MKLEMKTLGSPEFALDGAPLRFARRKTMALLLYLGARSPEIAANSAAGLLWPEFPPDKARASLRHAIADAANVASRPIIVRTGMQLSLSADLSLDCDVVAFREASKKGLMDGDRKSLLRAAHLYRGSFLEGFYLDDALIFEDWQLLEAENCRSLADEVLTRLAETDLEEGRIVEAEMWARRLSEISPLSGTAHRILMELAIGQGNVADAINRYSVYARLLERELGLRPDPRVEAVRARIAPRE